MKKAVKIILVSLAGLVLASVLFLYYLSGKHHDVAHRKVVEYLNRQFGSRVTFQDFSLSYLRSFPRIHLELTDLAVYDGSEELLKAGDVDILLNLRGAWKKELKIERLIISDLVLNQVIDSLKAAGKLQAVKTDSAGNAQSSFLLQSRHIEIRNALLSFNNKIKHNRTCIRILQSQFQLRSDDSLFVFTGKLEGNLDSLISNDNPLFVNQPVHAKDIRFSINRNTGVKKLESGTLQTHSLILKPRLRMQPLEDGQLIDLDISGEDDFDEFLGLFEFHLGFDLQQVNPQAKLNLSYKQSGFVNPHKRAYSELDFEISDAIFTGEGLPFPVELIWIKGNYNNGKGHSPETVELEIDSLYAEVNESFLRGHFRLSNLKDPFIDAYLTANVNLSHLLKEDENLRLAGMIDLTLSVNGRLSELRQLHMEGRQHASAEIKIQNLNLVMKDKGYSVQLHTGTTTLNNHLIEISAVVGAFNESAFHFGGHIENFDQYLLSKNEKVTGRIVMNFEELDLTKLDFKGSDKGITKRSPGLPFELVAIELLAKGEKIITPFGDLENISTDLEIEDDLIKINHLGFDYQDGHIESSGMVRLDENGIESVTAKLNVDFDHLETEKIISTLAQKSAGQKNDKGFSLPEQTDLDLSFHAKKITFKDLELSNTSFHLHGTDHDLEIKKLRTNLPFGVMALDLIITDYTSGKLRFVGDIDLDVDSLSISDLLEKEYVRTLFGDDTLQESRSEKSKKTSGLPQNIDLSLKLSADQLVFENIKAVSMELEMDYSGKGIGLEKLDLGFADGKIHVHGNLKKDASGSYPGYLYLKTDNLSIQNILKSFDNFDQDAFTWQNSSGMISSASHHYFKMDRYLEFLRNENFWLANVMIHHAEFDKVEPIEKSLFFVGHKAKDTMIVSELDVNILLARDRLYFRNLLMNDNIANLALSGEVHLDAYEMDLWAEISLSDLLLRSKKERMAETQAGTITLDRDSKLYLRMFGALSDHQLKLGSEKKYKAHLVELAGEINSAREDFRESAPAVDPNQGN